MSHPKPQRTSFVALMTIIAFLVLGPTLLAQSQTRRPPQERGTPKVLIFESKGVSRASEDAAPLPPPPPPDLSVALKKELLKGLNPPAEPGSIYFKVTPRNSIVAFKGHLIFRNAKSVDAATNSANWWPAPNEPAPNEKFLQFYFKSEAAGRRYLIDCSVRGDNNYPFKIFTSSNLLQTIESVGAPGQHLVFILDATDNGWDWFYITGGQWYFYSCEVTHL